MSIEFSRERRSVLGRRWAAARVVFLCWLSVAAAQGTPSAYHSDFGNAQIGKVPDDILVLDGPFAVREVEGKKCLELAADPIGSFGALFGPDGVVAADVKARIQAAPTGKRFPEFGVGAGGPGGFKLILVPSRQLIELRKGDDAQTAAKYAWMPGSWTWFRLRIEPKDKPTWSILGKVWRQGEPEPRNWTITAQDAQPPPPGKASIWGSDFSEKPIRFDDLSVTVLK